MLIFWSIAGVLLLFTLFILIRVLLKTSTVPAGAATQISVSIYKERLAELERERVSGVITDEQMFALRAELERSLLNDINIDSNNVSTSSARSRWLGLAASLSLPLVAVLLYYQLGKPELIEQLQEASLQQSNNDVHEELPSVEELVELLVKRIQDNPDDKKGWSILVRSYMALGHYDEAVGAASKLLSLSGNQPHVMLLYADALAMRNGGSLLGEPSEYVQKALELEPDNQTGLWLAGMGANEAGNYKLAINYWRRLLPQLQNGTESHKEITRLISQAEKQPIDKGGKIDTGVAEVETDKIGKSVKVHITLAPDLEERVKPEDTLFIFARPADGSAMPVAVIRKQATDLPVSVTLDDSSAMIASRRISNFDEVIVGARISKSGNAVAQKGDLTGKEFMTTLSNSEPVNILISDEIL